MRYVAGLLVLVGIVWMGWRFVGPSAPEPSAERMTALDPQIREMIEKAAREVKWNRRNRAVRRQLAMVYEANQLHDLAAETYAQLVRADGDDENSWYHLALVEQERAQYGRAITAFERCIAIESNYAPAHWRLGNLLLETGRPKEARESFERALRIEPNDPAAVLGLARTKIALNEHEEAIAFLNDHYLPPQLASYEQYLLADALRRAGRLEEARSAARGASTSQPVWRDEWAQEAQRYRTGTSARRKQAEALMAAGRAAEALGLLEELRDEGEPDPMLLNMLGAAYSATGQRERGLETFKAAVRLDPNDYPSRINLARAYLRNVGDSAAQMLALDQVTQALRLEPESSEAWSLRGSILESQGNLDSATDAYLSAAKFDARDLHPYVRAGALMLQRGKWDEAAETAHVMLAHDPDYGDAHVILAGAMMELGRYAEAEHALERAYQSTVTRSMYEATRQRLEKLRANESGNRSN